MLRVLPLLLLLLLLLQYRLSWVIFLVTVLLELRRLIVVYLPQTIVVVDKRLCVRIFLRQLLLVRFARTVDANASYDADH